MKFVTLTDEEFMEFVNSRPEKNFFQTTMMKERIECDGLKVYLVGVKKGKKVIAASLIAETNHTFMGCRTYEAYKGFILDYQDEELVHFMTVEVKKFLKEKKALRLIIDPYIPNVSRNAEAEIVEGVDNRHVKNFLHRLGYKDHEGAQVKWCYCLDIAGKTSEELFNDFRSSTRNNINKTQTKFLLNLKTLKRDELSEFKQITSDTCDRREFQDKTLQYYEEMYDKFGKDVTFKVVELNCDTYINHLEELNKELERKITEISDASSNKKKKEQMKQDIDNNKKKIEEAKELQKEKGNIIPLSGAMFMLYGDEIVYLFSGSYAEYMYFCGQYRLQWEIIKYAADNHYRRYNFYGIQDVFNPNGKDRGVYEFKKGFGGYVEELLGSFELSITPKNDLYRFLHKVKHIIKK